MKISSTRNQLPIKLSCTYFLFYIKLITYLKQFHFTFKYLSFPTRLSFTAAQPTLTVLPTAILLVPLLFWYLQPTDPPLGTYQFHPQSLPIYRYLPPSLLTNLTHQFVCLVFPSSPIPSFSPFFFFASFPLLLFLLFLFPPSSGRCYIYRGR